MLQWFLCGCRPDQWLRPPYVRSNCGQPQKLWLSWFQVFSWRRVRFQPSCLFFLTPHMKLHLYVVNSKVRQSSSSSSSSSSSKSKEVQLRRGRGRGRNEGRAKSAPRNSRVKLPKFLQRSDWTLAARGGAYMKLRLAGTVNHAKDVI